MSATVLQNTITTRLIKDNPITTGTFWSCRRHFCLSPYILSRPPNEVNSLQPSSQPIERAKPPYAPTSIYGKSSGYLQETIEHYHLLHVLNTTTCEHSHVLLFIKYCRRFVFCCCRYKSNHHQQQTTQQLVDVVVYQQLVDFLLFIC